MENIIRKILNDGGYLKGWILLDIRMDYFKQQNIGFIYEVYVLPNYRGKGYSKELIKAALEELYIHGCNEIERNTRSTNFYKEIGFVNHQR
ncbi:GNAT family N-acetyltransferase [Priestia megaterium]|uniref:GNAT family N-acetyltransferase n=1 Tax=Priestia megaterium TaxID=1404 RepID=UPI001596FAE7|nr:GNAT family N-acetyltransferase [Priestia megaterium]